MLEFSDYKLQILLQTVSKGTIDQEQTLDVFEFKDLIKQNNLMNVQRDIDNYDTYLNILQYFKGLNLSN